MSNPVQLDDGESSAKSSSPAVNPITDIGNKIVDLIDDSQLPVESKRADESEAGNKEQQREEQQHSQQSETEQKPKRVARQERCHEGIKNKTPERLKEMVLQLSEENDELSQTNELYDDITKNLQRSVDELKLKLKQMDERDEDSKRKIAKLEDEKWENVQLNYETIKTNVAPDEHIKSLREHNDELGAKLTQMEEKDVHSQRRIAELEKEKKDKQDKDKELQDKLDRCIHFIKELTNNRATWLFWISICFIPVLLYIGAMLNRYFSPPFEEVEFVEL